MKVGIMGGTFDPIHIGHLLLGEFAYEDFGLDEIWFVPNGNPPHKETKDSEQALRNRVEMVRLAIEHIRKAIQSVCTDYSLITINKNPHRKRILNDFED